MDDCLIWFANWVCKNDNRLIIVLSCINIIVFFVILFLQWKGNEEIRPNSDKRYRVSANMEWDSQQIKKLSCYERWLLLAYTVFANLTAIFPLLGILGTVAALVTYDSSEDMMNNLMIALSTTLLGVAMAIFFKLFDSFISAGIDILVGEIDYIIQNTDIKEEIEDEK